MLNYIVLDNRLFFFWETLSIRFMTTLFYYTYFISLYNHLRNAGDY